MEQLPIIILTLVLSIPVALLVNLITPWVSRQFNRITDAWARRNTAASHRSHTDAVFFAHYPERFTQFLVREAIKMLGLALVSVISFTVLAGPILSSEDPSAPILVPMYGVLGIVSLLMALQTGLRAGAQYRHVRRVEDYLGLTPDPPVESLEDEPAEAGSE